MLGRNPPWSRDELILALELYFRVSPRHTSQNNPEIIALSKILNRMHIHGDRPDEARFRNPNGVYMKLSNFLRLDPSYDGKGLDAGSKKDEEVWADFAGDRAHLAAVAEAIKTNVEDQDGSGIKSDNLDEEDEASEGTILLRQHKIRERSGSLAQKKKNSVLRKFGHLECEVCGFEFKDMYGTLGLGFIECHHIVALATLVPGQKTRLHDLAIVCSNCHRMLHRKNGPSDMAGLRLIISGLHHPKA